MAKTQVLIRMEIVPDDDCPDISYLEQEEFRDRLAAYQRGEFGFCGVRAVAEIRVPYGADWILTSIKSPGLWCIEDDSGDAYFRSVFNEEKATLLDMLASMQDFEITEES